MLGAIAGRVVARRRAARSIALAGMAKFAPLALAPLLRHARRAARWRFVARRRRWRSCRACCSSSATAACTTFYDRTLGFQASRGSPFSIWGLYGWDTAQARGPGRRRCCSRSAVAFVPRRRDVVGLAALAAAVLIALQLGVTHWFYLYIVWFFGPVLIALLGDAEPAERRSRRSPTPSSSGAYPRPPWPGAEVAASPRRCAAVAASTRERTPSLARIRETWTLAVFSEMKSVSPISRLVWPSATQREDGELARR